MGFTPRGRGNYRGDHGRRGSFRGGRGGGSFNGGNQGPPEEIVEVGKFQHACQEDIVCKLTHEKIPYNNVPVYLENKEQVGKIDEVFGPIKDAVNSHYNS